MVNETEVKQILQKKLAERAKKALTIIEVYAMKAIKKNFEVGGRPAWKASKKSKKNKGTKTLVISGQLSNVSATANPELLMIVLSTSPLSRAYARIHNEGGTINMPARALKFREKRYKDGTKRTVFASSKNKRITMERTTKPYKIVMPKREFMMIPEEDVNEMVRKVNS